MGMNPDTNEFEQMTSALDARFDEVFASKDVAAGHRVERPVFKLGELIELRNCVFRVTLMHGSQLTLESIGLISGSTPILERPFP